MRNLLFLWIKATSKYRSVSPLHGELRKNYCSEKAMASHSSTLAWKNPMVTEEPGRLQVGDN